MFGSKCVFCVLAGSTASALSLMKSAAVGSAPLKLSDDLELQGELDQLSTKTSFGPSGDKVWELLSANGENSLEIRSNRPDQEEIPCGPVIEITGGEDAIRKWGQKFDLVAVATGTPDKPGWYVYTYDDTDWYGAFSDAKEFAKWFRFSRAKGVFMEPQVLNVECAAKEGDVLIECTLTFPSGDISTQFTVPQNANLVFLGSGVSEFFDGNRNSLLPPGRYRFLLNGTAFELRGGYYFGNPESGVYRLLEAERVTG